ncbi:hypothetical protein ELQ88_24130 [Pseudomonas sp. MPC6]|nr:hypothetical protein ELQ88_24130 [Pseudomonas sp. MPC6]
MLAKDVNDNAFFLSECVVLETIASKLAPTGGGCARHQFHTGLLFAGRHKESRNPAATVPSLR